MAQRTRPVEDRFWRKVRVDPDTGCWVWLGAHHERGYGRFGADGATVYAHRWAYEHFVGEPAGDVLMHLCDNPPCCNPSHLKPGTQVENMAHLRRGEGPCPHHPEIIRRMTAWGLKCNRCQAERARRGYHRRKGRQL
jgi:hypothetical protein